MNRNEAHLAVLAIDHVTDDGVPASASTLYFQQLGGARTGLRAAATAGDAFVVVVLAIVAYRLEQAPFQCSGGSFCTSLFLSYKCKT